jgi:hypothetical protein
LERLCTVQIVPVAGGTASCDPRALRCVKLRLRICTGRSGILVLSVVGAENTASELVRTGRG